MVSLLTRSVPDMNSPIEPVDLLFRAALLAGLGSRSRSIVTTPNTTRTAHPSQRTCIDAGSPLLLSVKATGQRSLRVFRQVPTTTPDSNFPRWIGTHFAPNGTTAYSMTDTFFRNQTAAWEHTLAFAKSADRLAQFHHYHAILGLKGRLFQTSYESNSSESAHWVTWQLDRATSPVDAITACHSAASSDAIQHLQDLFGRSILPRSGPWSLSCNLDASNPHLKLGTTLWARFSEAAGKHHRMAAIVAQMGGDSRFSEALYKLLDSARFNQSTRIGRAVEVELLGDRAIDLEFYLSVPTPHSQPQETTV